MSEDPQIADLKKRLALLETVTSFLTDYVASAHNQLYVFKTAFADGLSDAALQNLHDLQGDLQERQMLFALALKRLGVELPPPPE